MAVGKNLHAGEDPKWWPQICPVDFGQGRRRVQAVTVAVQLQHAVQRLKKVSSHLPQE